MGIFYSKLELDPNKVNKQILDGFKSIIDDLNKNSGQTKQKIIKYIETGIKREQTVNKHDWDEDEEDPDALNRWVKSRKDEIDDIKKLKKDPLTCSVFKHYDPCGIAIDVLPYNQVICILAGPILEDVIIKEFKKDSKNKQLINTYKLDIHTGDGDEGCIYIESKLKKYEYKEVGKDKKKK